MENNDGNIKSQQTGGLKLMTVFIAVLALHVVVIGGFTVYHLMTGSTTDADLTLDKGAKKVDASTSPDGTTPDATKTATTDSATTPATATTPEATATSDAASGPIQPATTKPAAPTVVATLPPATPVAPITSTPAPVTSTPAPVVALAPTVPPTGINSLAPPPEPTLSLAAPAPATSLNTTPMASAPVTPGPVHMPSGNAAMASTHSGASMHEAAMESSAKKQTYTVKITDSYKKIAKAHHITVAELKEANHIKDNTLHAGQKLVIPSAKTSLARADAEPATNLAAAPSGTTSHHHFYTVEKGDTLSYIAKKFNTTKTAILAANDISNPTKLTVGKKLKIPAAKESRSANLSAPVHTAPTAVAPVAAPIAQPAEAPQPVATQPSSPQPVVTPELANMTF